MSVAFLTSFGLRENPFNTNPDPDYLFLPHRTQVALDNMACAIQARKGLILLTGEPGTGKTTLLNRLMQWLRMQKMPVAFIFNPRLEVNDVFELMLASFGIPSNSRSKGSMLARLNQWLDEGYQRGMNPVLIIDEAQGLPVLVLEEIRMLLNEETPREKLLQIVLSGQPEFEEKLKRPELRQLRQRISLRCHTMPFSRAETDGYIQRRLCIARATNQVVFLPEAIDAVHRYSRGIPRVMNMLCEYALMESAATKIQPVPAYLVDEAARQLRFDDVRPVRGQQSPEDFAPPLACAADSGGLAIAEIHPSAASIPPAASRELSFDMQARGSRATIFDGQPREIGILDGPSKRWEVLNRKKNDGNPILEREKVSSNSISLLEAELIWEKAAGFPRTGEKVGRYFGPLSRKVKTQVQRVLDQSRLRQIISEARRTMARLDLGPALQRIAACSRRWLQEPFPGAKVHRRLEH
jgi:general secretion pathway protein A